MPVYTRKRQFGFAGLTPEYVLFHSSSFKATFKVEHANGKSQRDMAEIPNPVYFADYCRVILLTIITSTTG
nr:hypothetical protein L203_05931 [Cryptococcus depauperatus CBS 7841]ODO04198.1 hypothetical protein L204_00553 [Cryptococcus depauperatus CBS 7855]